MRLLISGVAVAGAVLSLSGCSSGASVDDLGQAVEDAGDEPTECPFDLDVSGALDGADVTPGEVTVQLPSTDSEPTYVDCSYDTADGELVVYVVSSSADGAAGLLVPTLQNDANLTSSDVTNLVDLFEPGKTVLAPGGTSAIVELDVDGDGSAAVLVSGGAVTGDDLASASESLADDVAST